MKGDKFMKLVVIILCCVVASYLLFSVTRFSGDGYTTYKAVRCEVGDGITTSGFVVRSERPILSATRDIVVLTRSEGEKVGKDQPVAATYRDEAARSRQEQLNALAAEIEQMKYAASFTASDLDSATLDTDILHAMNQVTVARAHRDFSAADRAAEDLKPYVLRRYINSSDAELLKTRIQEAQNRYSQLSAQSKAESGEISAPAAGWFSGTVDGLEEHLTPEFLETASVSALEKYSRSSLQRDPNAVGKLVSSPKWYYAAIVPSLNVQDLKEGSRVEVNFVYDFYQPITMKVERISPSEGDRCILVLSSESYIQEAVSTRLQTADLIFEDLSGLRVPKTAIYVNDEGRSGVYVLEGADAKWKEIKILYDDGDSYIVELDKSSTKNLWPEDEIILTTGEIFNGKVMVK